MRHPPLFPAVFLTLLVAACTTVPPVKAPAPQPVPVAEPAPAPVPVPEPVAAPAPTPAPDTEYVVSAEKKQTSLEEIRALVDRLNSVIASKNFSEWKTHLDQAYIATYSDPARLQAYTASSPFLKQNNIKLKTLEDYFKIVVVSSRADGKDRVDDITFVDEDRVNVWTVVDNERVLLYLLKLYGKEWKISSW